MVQELRHALRCGREKRRHLLHLGARVDRRQYNVYQSSSARGTLNFSGGFTNNPASPAGTGNGFADLLLGAPNNGNIYILDERAAFAGLS